MKYIAWGDVTFSKAFEIEAKDEEDARKQADEILSEITRHDICEDVLGWDIADTNIAIVVEDKNDKECDRGNDAI